MELEELKMKWSELDSRLSKVETMNKQAIKELVTLRTNTSLTNVRNRMWYGAIVSFFVTAIFLIFLSKGTEMNQIMNPYSIQILIAFLVLGTIYAFFRAISASTINIADTTGKLIKDTSKLKRMIIWERLVSFPLIIVFYAVIMFLERGWIIERGRVIAATILFAALCLLAFISFITQKKQEDKLLKELDESIKELNQL